MSAIERPLIMPDGYEFSARNVDWNSYKKDYRLRTDAVWEKEKLRQYFYAIYKGVNQLFFTKIIINIDK